MTPRSKTKVTAQILLKEIDRLFEAAEYYQSRESGKRFYESKKFPKLLSAYIVHSGHRLGDHAKKFGMSTSTLESMAAGGRLSDNMLSRIRSSLSRDISASKKKAVFPGDWRDAGPAEVAEAISVVSEKLIFLKKVIESSNFLQSEDSPIDKIQILQLISLLTATIHALNAPFVDQRRTGGFFRWLGKLAKTSAEKGVEKLVVDAMQDAVKSGRDLVRRLSDEAGVSDLGDVV